MLEFFDSISFYTFLNFGYLIYNLLIIFECFYSNIFSITIKGIKIIIKWLKIKDVLLYLKSQKKAIHNKIHNNNKQINLKYNIQY